LASTHQLPAGNPVGVDDRRLPSDLSRSFDQLWWRYLEAESEGEAELRDRILREIARLRVERNAFHLHDIASAFTFRGATLLERGDLAGAKASFETATRLDPSLPTPLFGLARVASRSGGFWPAASLPLIVKGYVAPLGSFWSGRYARIDLLLIAVLALLVVFGIFAAAMVYRYAVLLNHDLEERLAAQIGASGVKALTCLILLLPLIATVGFAWLIPYWLALTFAHQGRSERALSVLTLVFFLALGPVLELHSLWAKTVVNPIFRAAISSEVGTFDATDIAVLQTALQQHPTDRDLKLILAIQYKNLGDYETSASVYREMLAEDATDVAAETNLGNVYFAQRDWQGAILQYTNAINDHPDFALAHYNKSLAHGESFEFSQRERARTQADNLDRRAIAAFEEKTGEQRAVADVRLGTDYVLAKFFGLSDSLHPSPPPSIRETVLASERVLGFAMGAILFAVLIVLLGLVFRDRGNTQRCARCRSPFCGRCQIGTGRRGLCTQCYHLFIVKDGVSAGARNQKIAQVGQAVRTRGVIFRALSVLAPGSGHFVEGLPLAGFLLLLVWAAAAFLLSAGRLLYPLVDPTLGLGGALHVYVAIAAMVLALVAANTMAQPEIGE
jgi:tetratricopeptide (TPR) repeat protein